ncbi:TRAP transporter small permease [Vibrio ulleungensis]|uniref:TRAP transporter small permease protein n=1 Tax=Vibrio ulleungensis TaxID=2807619 RepID=A0ABS2HK57_9VIBR|nr:TRAP transporter small permease [Vibrio ulleungensis]MBM7037056.1 TRAP transporter small permease [Vibrio ulleungensis]
MFKQLESALNIINKPIAAVTSQLAGLLLFAMTVIVLIQIAFRYVLNMPLSWTDESSRFLMIYMTYLCLPIIYLDDRNIAMTFITDKLQGTRLYELLMLFAHLTALILFGFWIYFGLAFLKSGSVMADSLPIPMYVVYAVPPVMLAVSCSFALQKLFGSIHRLFAPKASEPKSSAPNSTSHGK